MVSGFILINKSRLNNEVKMLATFQDDFFILVFMTNKEYNVQNRKTTAAGFF